MSKIKENIKINFPHFHKIIVRITNPTGPIPLGLWLLNFLVQRIFGVNKKTPWMVHYSSCVTAPEKIKIGANVGEYFAKSSNYYIQGINGIIIEDNTIFAPGVKIISSNHDPLDLSKHIACAPIRIGKNCWIGASAIILPGVNIGDNCIIGAGAVVTKDFPDNSVIVGNPAKIIRNTRKTNFDSHN